MMHMVLKIGIEAVIRCAQFAILVLFLFCFNHPVFAADVTQQQCGTNYVGSCHLASQRPSNTNFVGICTDVPKVGHSFLKCYSPNVDNSQCPSRIWRRGQCGTGERAIGTDSMFYTKICCVPNNGGSEMSVNQCQRSFGSNAQCTKANPDPAKYADKGPCCVGSGCDSATSSGFRCWGAANPTTQKDPTNPTTQKDPTNPTTQKDPTSNSGSISFKNPLQFNTFQDFIMAVLSYLQGIIVLLALVFIVIGGVFYTTSAGNDGQVKTAKAAITAAMIGLAIGIAAPTFLKEIVNILCANNSGTVLCPVDQAPISSAQSLSTILLNTLNFLLGITGVLGVIMFVVGGVMYLTSGGADQQTDTAKDILKASAIGVAIVLAALVIVKQIATLLT